MAFYAPTEGPKSVESINGRTTMYNQKVPDDVPFAGSVPKDDEDIETNQIDQEHDATWDRVEEVIAATSDKQDKKYFKQKRQDAKLLRAVGGGTLRSRSD